MVSKPQFPQKPVIALTIALLLCLLFIIFNACRKTDLAQQQPLHDVNFTAQFFKTTSTDKDVLRIIALLKAENERTGFVDKLPADCGLPIWDKLLLSQQATATARATPGGDTSFSNIIIPLTENGRNLSSLLVATKEHKGSYEIACYTGNNYLYSYTHTKAIDPGLPTKTLLLFFYMENRSFGTTTFYNIPATLFPSCKALDSRGNKTINILPDSTFTNSNFAPVEICITVTYPCDNIAHPQETCSETICIEVGGGSGNWPEPHYPNVPSPGGNGGGGGENWPNLPPIPCIPNFGGAAWYSNIVLPPNPCDPPPLPPDSMPILERLSLYSSKMRNASDSIFQKSMMLPQKERGFILVKKNGVIYPKNFVIGEENSVIQKWFLQPGEVLLGQNHTHPDTSINPNDRPCFSYDDILDLKFSHGHHTIKNYVSFIELGNIRYALVIEDPAKAILFFNRNENFIGEKYDSFLKSNPNYSSNYRLAGEQAVAGVLGLSADPGIGLYKTTDTLKGNFIKVN